MNKAILIGNLIADPETRTNGESTKFTSFSIAVNAIKKDTPAFFIRVSTIGNIADACEKYLKKGSKVCVEGRLKNRSWTTQAGEKRHSTELDAERVEFLSARKDTEQTN
jgi:single-strand DNA-binding protein